MEETRDMAGSKRVASRPQPQRTATRAVPTIDTLFVVMACRALKESGIDPDDALAQAGIERTILDDQEARIAFRLNVELFEVAARLTGDSCFGLHLGAATDTKNVGVLGYVALSSATIADAIAHAQRYYRVLTDGEVFDTRREGDRLIVEYRVLDPSAQHSRQYDDSALMGTVRLMQIATGKRIHPDEVELEHAEPEASAEYRRLYGAPVRFGAAGNLLVFPASILDLPIHSANRQLLHILERYCESVLRERGQEGDLMQQVEEMVMRLLPDGPPGAAAVARALGMSKRTLSRRLQAQGVSYRELVDELRAGLSRRYLEDRKLRMSEIAYLLGYSHLSAFNHAFRRWTGKSPTAFRGAAA